MSALVPTVEHKVTFFFYSIPSLNLSLTLFFFFPLYFIFLLFSISVFFSFSLSSLPCSSFSFSCSPSLTLGQVTIDKTDPSTVEALVGQTVVLPCRVSPPPSSTVIVEWRRDGVPLSTHRCVIMTHYSQCLFTCVSLWLHPCIKCFPQTSPSAQWFLVGGASNWSRLWLVFVPGQTGTWAWSPLHLPFCHR